MPSQSTREESGDDIPADAAEVYSAIERYTEAVERRLKPGLDAACEQRDKLYSELEKIDVQQHSINTLNSSSEKTINASVNIGEEFYISAEVNMDMDGEKKIVLQLAPTEIYIEVGIEEAEKILEERKTLLEKVAAGTTERIVGIQAHLKAVLTNVAKLRQALGEMKRDETRTERMRMEEENGF